VNYQGKVYQPSGAAVPDGAYKIAFSIYDVPTGGTAIWTETYDALQVKGSAFHVLLGSVNPIGASIFGSAERFLGVKLATDPELSPRQKIASVPYAMVAEKAANADVAQTVPDGVIATSKLADGGVTSTKLGDSSVTTAKVADGAVGAAQIAPLEAWIAPTLNPGWQNYTVLYGGDFNGAGFCKDIIGFVHLRGLIASALSSGVAFSLPVGYRPSGTGIYAARVLGATGRVDVRPNGEVYGADVAGWVSLDGITFRAEQ